MVTWPHVAMALVGLGIVLAYATDFWENLVNIGKRTVETKVEVEVEVIPQELLNDITEVIVEMRDYARRGEHNPKRVIAWAKQLSEAIEDEE